MIRIRMVQPEKDPISTKTGSRSNYSTRISSDPKLEDVLFWRKSSEAAPRRGMFNGHKISVGIKVVGGTRDPSPAHHGRYQQGGWGPRCISFISTVFLWTVTSLTGLRRRLFTGIRPSLNHTQVRKANSFNKDYILGIFLLELGFDKILCFSRISIFH